MENRSLPIGGLIAHYAVSGALTGFGLLVLLTGLVMSTDGGDRTMLQAGLLFVVVPTAASYPLSMVAVALLLRSGRRRGLALWPYVSLPVLMATLLVVSLVVEVLHGGVFTP